MTAEQSKAYLKSLTDEELRKLVDDAHKDTSEAGIKEKDSEWHQNCFAALLMCSYEMDERKIKIK